MDLVAFSVGAAVGMLGSAFGIFLYLRARPGGPSRVTFHRPRPGVLVVEVREDLSAQYAASLREWFESVEDEGTSVLVLALGGRA